MSTEDEGPAEGKFKVGNITNSTGVAIEEEASANVTIGQLHQHYYEAYHAGSPFQAPPLPAHFVERPEISRPLLAQVLAEDPERSTLVVSALYGLGGIGKSTLAQEMVTRREVRERFPDGVLWATLGQQPDLLGLLHSWLHALGLYDPKALPPNIEAAAATLRTCLVDKACLLVVDDAWQAEHALPFLGGGPRCRALITTREAVIAQAANAELFDVGGLSEGQALALLANKFCRALLADEVEPAQRFAQAVGHLPLALELAAAQVAEGILWPELLADFNAETARLEALNDPDMDDLQAEALRKERSLRALFALSLRRLAVDELHAFAWLGLLAEDAPFGAEPAGVLWGVEPDEATWRLKRLAGKALLLPVPVDEGRSTYRMHDLLGNQARGLVIDPPTHDFPGLELPQAHAALLERYRAKTQGGRWHTLPDDGYIHQHLAWHMEQAGRPDLLQDLLAEETAEGQNGWYSVCDRLGRPTRFIADVNTCWRLSATDMGQAVRCALILASLNSLARNFSTDGLIERVTYGLWTPTQALATALQIKGEADRSLTLVSLAPHLAPELLAVTLRAARQIKDQFSRSQALTGLAPYLPPEQQAGVLAEALAAARKTEIEAFYSRSLALARLAPHLPLEQQPTVLDEALAAARQIKDEIYRTQAVLDLPHNLPPELLTEVLAATRSIQHDYVRSQALTRLAPHLPAEQQTGVLAEALSSARQIKDKDARFQPLVRLLPHLPPEQQPEVVVEALTAAWLINYEYPRSAALVRLLPHLPPERQPAVLAATLATARKIDDESTRSLTLASLVAPHLPPEQQPAMLAEALATARQIKDQRLRCLTLGDLATHLPAEQQAAVLAEALVSARQLEDRQARSETLTGLVPHLPPEQRPVVLVEALASARLIEDSHARSWILANLAPHLPSELLTEALETARRIEDKRNRSEALTRLVPHLPPEQQPAVLAEVLATVRQFDREELRSQALSGLAPHLLPELLAEALAAIQQIEAEHHRSLALASLAPHLLPELLAEALAHAREINSDHYRSSALTSLAIHLPPEQQPAVLVEALSAARQVEDEMMGSRALALADLAPHLPLEQQMAVLAEAMASARQIQLDLFDSRARILASLFFHLPPQLLAEALSTARQIDDEINRCQALARLSSHLPAEQQAAVLAEALATARQIDDEHRRCQVLARLISHLPSEQRAVVLAEALASARQIEDETISSRAQALAGLVPYLPPEQQPAVMAEALAAARQIDDKGPHSQALASLAGHLATYLTRDQLLVLWQETLPILARRARTGLLSDLFALAPVLHRLGGEAAMGEIFRAIQDVGRWWP